MMWKSTGQNRNRNGEKNEKNFTDTDHSHACRDAHGMRQQGSFFDCYTAALVPTDGSDVYYLPEDAGNFWEVFGKNTEYVIDPEECLADNFSFAMTYGMEGQDYKNPEIIQAVLDHLSKSK